MHVTVDVTGGLNGRNSSREMKFKKNNRLKEFRCVLYFANIHCLPNVSTCFIENLCLESIIK